MPSFINSNLVSLNAQHNLNKSQSSLATSLQRLSSGLRINSAKDDAAGMSIADRFTSQIRGLDQAARNANDGISLAQTAEGALNSIDDNLQRIRELAVQSANGSNQNIDRTGIQAEASQLLAEIDRVAGSTQFNGVNLLDGSFKGVNFQVGANAGQTINMSMNSASTSSLGSSDAASLSARSTTTGTALHNGDLIINGVSIQGTTSTSDAASTTNASYSAIAKAAAINAQSAATGVTAKADVNTVAGASMTGSVASGILTINGVKTGTVYTSSDTAASRASVIAAVNAVSGQTGVVAVDTGSDSGGVKLVAADGRNIDFKASGASLTAADTGINNLSTADTVNYGGYTLTSTSAINISQGAGSIDNAGLATGSYSAMTAYATTSAGTTTSLGSGDIKINGVLIGASSAASDTSSTTYASASAIAKAAAINAVSAQTGVKATVNATTVAGANQSGMKSTTSGTITINGITTAKFSETDSADTTRAAAVQAINAISGQTGVMAVDTHSDTTGVQLVAADGRNISVSVSGVAEGDLGMATAGVTVGTFTLSSAKAFTVDNGTSSNGTTNFGLSVGTYGAGKNGQALGTIDLTTADGASKALAAIDNALASVNASRSALGAYQNRFTATVTNLQTNSENLNAARSRIQDADFAAETANLSRAQILQQAGTAMLAQANQLPQGVMALLR